MLQRSWRCFNSPMILHFATADVFTDRLLGGNPVAVILNADGLSTEAMQAIASEFNLSCQTQTLMRSTSSSVMSSRLRS